MKKGKHYRFLRNWRENQAGKAYHRLAKQVRRKQDSPIASVLNGVTTTHVTTKRTPRQRDTLKTTLRFPKILLRRCMIVNAADQRAPKTTTRLKFSKTER